MRQSKNILTDKEMELVSLLMQDCQSTGDIQSNAYSGTSGRLFRFYPDSKPEHPDTLSVS